ncbi:hypothetical protein GTZ99_12350 [Novosphingobium sp. FSY-8]|uniref:Uncharacterized protein n=1 Tax=Novosphingobium ovatum TaxID=1908523 RepID=A0ABW9XFM8_9SPHN|nr:hypothetical protein [Novosphingobium ovatum]NBC37341.1 hypothetical protein [Novosphingobium ovatum]
MEVGPVIVNFTADQLAAAIRAALTDMAGEAGESLPHITREEMAQRIYAARYPGTSFDSVTGAKRAKWLDRAERAIATR